MATASALFFASLLLLLLLCDFSGVSGTEKENYHAIRVTSLLPTTACSSTPKDINRRGLKITHRRGPCSPYTDKLSPRQILLNDQLRVDSLKSKLTKRSQVQESLSQTTVPAHFGSSLGVGDYIVTVGFGTPKRDLSLIFDTGSDLTWIQCKPCVGYCYSQQEPIFNPPDSSSYSNVSCNTPECTRLRSATGNPTTCSSSTCVYGVMYGDQSYSVGFFGHETLTLTKSVVFPNFLFGCGQKNRGNFGKTAGLLGLGRDGLSFVSQTAKKFGQVFSYCLPSPASSAGYLTFGDSGKRSGVQFTPMLTNPNSASFYFLDLTDIIVGDRPLNISPSVFATGGTIIDSGTVITRLPPTAYATLRSTFRQMMSDYPSAAALSILDTCYNFNGYDSIDVPKIVLQFRGGADVEVDFISGIFLVNSQSQVCLAFAANSDADDTAIIGNKQQQTINVAYDLQKRRVGFASGGCT